jgi:hypothetical protein
VASRVRRLHLTASLLRDAIGHEHRASLVQGDEQAAAWAMRTVKCTHQNLAHEDERQGSPQHRGNADGAVLQQQEHFNGSGDDADLQADGLRILHHLPV